MIKAVVEELGFAFLRLAEGLVGDEDTTAAIAGNLSESPVTNNVTRLVVDVLVAVRHPLGKGTVGIL